MVSFKSVSRILLSAVFLMAGVAQAQSITAKIDNKQGVIQITGKGFNGNQNRYQVQIFKNGSGFKQMNTNENGSFGYNGKAEMGDRFQAQVNNWYGSGSHFESDEFVVVSDSRDDDRDQPKQPQRDPVTDAEIREYANQQARTVANRIANTYGKLENWKYNFQRGYWYGVNDFGSLISNSHYREGRADGYGSGTSSGRTRGESEARTNAISRAVSDVFQRFASILNTNREPDLSMNVPSVSVPTFNAPKQQTGKLARQLQDLDNALIGELDDLYYEDGGFVLRYSRDIYESIYISHLYNSSKNSTYQLVDSWFREEYAYQEWENNRLGGNYDYNVYNKMDSNERYKFRQKFKDIYSNVIDEKFMKKKYAENDPAFYRGVFYGARAAQAQA